MKQAALIATLTATLYSCSEQPNRAPAHVDAAPPAPEKLAPKDTGHPTPEPALHPEPPLPATESVDAGKATKQRAIVRFGRLMEKGSYPRSSIDRKLKEHTDAMKACYRAGLRRKPKLTGRVSIGFFISADENTIAVRVEDSTLGDESVEACLAGIFKRMRFPTGGTPGMTHATVPIILFTK